MGAIGAFLSCWFVLIWVVPVHSSDAEVVTVDVIAARDLLLLHQNQTHLFLDVRTEQEFNSGHLDNAFNIPYMINTPKGMMNNPKFMDEVVSLFGKEDRLIVGCRSGVRSLKATTDLVQNGFKHVYNMGGGYNDWIQNEFEIEKPYKEEL